MDAVQMIIDDHEKVRTMYKEFEEAEKRRKKKIAEQIMDDLDVHAALEEEIFYPAVRKADKEKSSVVAESVEEHHVVHMLIGELRDMTSMNEQYEAKFTVLMENVQHHMEEEEQEMLPEARKILGDKTEKLAEQMDRRKQELMAEKPS